MFRDIKVLIAESDRLIEKALSDCLTALTFQVVTVSNTSACMNAINKEKPDILLLDEELVNGTSQIVLDYWIAERHGPVAVFSDLETYGPDFCHPFLGKGVWNVLTLDRTAEETHGITNVQALNTVMLRYAQIIEWKRACGLQAESISRLKKMQRALWVTTITLAISFVAYAGPSVVPKVLSMLFGGG